MGFYICYNLILLIEELQKNKDFIKYADKIFIENLIKNLIYENILWQ